MVLGCGRSGTSIFGELFGAISTYAYRSEPSFDLVMASDFSTPQAFKVPRESLHHPAPPGLSFPLDAFLSVAPDAAIFWIVRHPLDAIASLRVGIGRDWGHHPRPPDWRAWLARPLIERCAHHWSFLNGTGFSQTGGRAHVMRFEAMIADPELFATEACETAGIDPLAQRADISSWTRRVRDEYDRNLEAATSRAYSENRTRRRLDRWREDLSAEDLDAALPIIAPVAASFGYVLPDGSR